MTTQVLHRIAGTEQEGLAAVVVEDLNPSDQREVLARYNLMSGDQVSQVVDAVASDRTWRDMPILERAAVFSRSAAYLRANQAMFGATVSLENGKVLREAIGEVGKCADFLDYYAGLARTSQGTLLADGRPNTYVRVVPEPVGLVLAICPWNDPMLTPARKLAPALIVGNSVVMKPARDTPLAALLLEEALLAGGLPPAALGVLITDHKSMRERVLDDPRLAAVTFTGSTPVGMALKESLASRNVRVQTEMGGKNAAIVLDDADIDLTVAAIVAGAFGQAGQRCTATSRLIVTPGVRSTLTEALAAATSQIRIGPSMAEETVMGPLVTREHRDDVLGFVQRAVAAGSEVIVGGEIPGGEEFEHGCFIEPTLLSSGNTEAEIWREEVFGPVIAVHEAKGLGEAIDLVNASRYGLAASVFTTSLDSAEKAIRHLDAGQISINLPTSGWDVHQPFGGFKESGSAFKEQGVDGLRFYTRTKTAAVRFA